MCPNGEGSREGLDVPLCQNCNLGGVTPRKTSERTGGSAKTTILLKVKNKEDLVNSMMLLGFLSK